MRVFSVYQCIWLSQQINRPKAVFHSLPSARSVGKAVNPKPADGLIWTRVLYSITTQQQRQRQQDTQANGFTLKYGSVRQILLLIC